MEILVARAEYTPVKQCEVNGPPLWVAEAAPIFLGSSTLLPSNVRHQSSCANDSTASLRSLRRLKDLPFHTLSSYSLLAFSHVHALSRTLRTCHDGNESTTRTLTVGRISHSDTTGPCWHCCLQGWPLLSQDIIKPTIPLPCLSHPSSDDHIPSISSIKSLVPGSVGYAVAVNPPSVSLPTAH
jgi:hypothetical protein